MFDNEIIAPGEKLKKIRKMLFISQEELSKKICSKNNVSLIENGKQRLSINLATSFAEKFNKAAEIKGIDIKTITADYLMQDEDIQANNVLAENIMKHLRKVETVKLFEQKFCEAEKLIEKYNIEDDKKIELYKLGFDFYYNKCSYYKSHEMCTKGLILSQNTQNSFEEAYFYISKSRNFTMQEYYDLALEQIKYAEKINNSICDDELSEKIYFVKALVYKKTNKHDKSLKYLKILANEYKNKENSLMYKILYANSLNDQKKYDEAKIKYNEILKIAKELNDTDTMAIIYRNLSELYSNQNNYNDAAIFITESLLCNPNILYLNEILYFASTILSHINKDVEMYLLRALEISEKNDRENLSLIGKILHELILIYMKREDEENINLMIEKAKELNIDCNLIYIKLLKYYRFKNEEKSIYFEDELIKLNELKK